MANELNVDVKVDVQNDQDLARLNGELDKTAASAGRLGDVGQGVFQGIGQSIAGAAIGLAQAGIGAAMDAIGNSISLASDRQEAASKAAILFGDAYDTVAEKSKTAARDVGVSSGEYLTLAGNVGNLVTNFGFSGDAAADMSTDIVQLAADVGSFNNAPTADVVEAIGAAFRGETEPIRKFGVMLDAASIQAKAMEMGLYDGVGAISASAKASATYALILDDTAKAQGDFGRTSDGLANSQKIANARIEESLTNLGDVIMPIVSTVLPLLADAITGAIDFAIQFATAIGGIIDQVRPLVDDLLGALAPALDVVQGIIEAVVGAIGVFVDGLAAIADGLHNVHRFLDPAMAANEDYRESFQLAGEQAGLTATEIDEAWRQVEEAARSGALSGDQDAATLIAAYKATEIAAGTAGRASIIASESADRAARDTAVAIEVQARAVELQAQAVRQTAAAIGDDYRESMRQAGQAAMAQAEADARGIGTAIPTEIGQGMIEASREVLDAADRLIQLLEEGLTPAEQSAKLQGRKYTQAVAAGVVSEIPGAKLAAQQMAVAAINTIEDAGDGTTGRGLKAIGEYYDSLLASGLTSAAARAALAAGGVADDTIAAIAARNDDAQDAGEDLTAAAARGTTSTSATMTTAGRNVASAWLQGLSSHLRSEAADRAVHDAAQAATSSLRGNSPPRTGPLRHIDTWGENVGAAWLEGVAKGAHGQPLGRVLGGLGAAASLRGIGPLGLSAGAPGRSVTIQVYAGVGDPVEIGRVTVEAIRAYERASGTEA